MKKFAKMLALSVATVLTLGMTVSAAESVSTTNPSVTADTLATQAEAVQAANPTATTEDGTAVTLTVEATTVEMFDDAETAADAMDLAANDGTTTVIAAFELDAAGATNVTISITVPGVTADGKYAFLHFNGTAWELIAATNNNGVLTGTFASLSPVAVVEIVDGAAPTTNNGGNRSSASAPAAAPAPAESPKTGETVPVAGVMALILIAGAAVCAKKVRFER